MTSKLRGTAPYFLRYVVVALYVAALCTLGGSVFSYLLYRGDVQKLAQYELSRVQTAAKIASAKTELARALGAQSYFKDRQDWLLRNYSAMSVYQVIFSSVPSKLRIVTLESRDTSNAVDGKSRVEIKVTLQTSGEEQASILKFAAALIDARLQLENIRQEVLPSGLLVYSFDLITYIAP